MSNAVTDTDGDDVDMPALINPRSSVPVVPSLIEWLRSARTRDFAAPARSLRVTLATYERRLDAHTHEEVDAHELARHAVALLSIALFRARLEGVMLPELHEQLMLVTPLCFDL